MSIPVKSKLQKYEFMSFTAPNYALYLAYLAIVNNARVFSHMNTRLKHETNSIARIIRGRNGHDLNISHPKRINQIGTIKSRFLFPRLAHMMGTFKFLEHFKRLEFDLKKNLSPSFMYCTAITIFRVTKPTKIPIPLW